MPNDHIEKAKDLLAKMSADINRQQEDKDVKKLLGEVLDELKKAGDGERKGRFDTQDAREVVKTAPNMGAGLQRMVDTSTSDGLIKDFQKMNDDVWLLSQMLKKDPRELKIYKSLMEHPFVQKTQDSFGGTGPSLSGPSTHYGADWIPIGFSADLIDVVRLQLKVAALHRRINMPAPTYKLPIGGTDVTAYLVGETITSGTPEGRPTASIPTSGTGVTLDAKKIGALVYFSEEITEDSLIPVLPYLRDSMARAMANAQEHAVINGQKTATIDTGYTIASTDVRKAWDGYRYNCQSAAKVDLSTWSTTTATGLLRSLRSKMGKYGVDPKNLVWITSIAGYHQMLSNADLLTLDKYGPNATLLSGELGKFDNIPIIVSEYVAENLNTLGVYDGVTTTKTLVALLYTPSWLFGDRRSITVKTKDNPEDDNHLLVCHQRLDFKPLYDTSSEYIVALGYNLAKL
jgi:HK97 family phage major capsid protein